MNFAQCQLVSSDKQARLTEASPSSLFTCATPRPTQTGLVLKGATVSRADIYSNHTSATNINTSIPPTEYYHFEDIWIPATCHQTQICNMSFFKKLREEFDGMSVKDRGAEGGQAAYGQGGTLGTRFCQK